MTADNYLLNDVVESFDNQFELKDIAGIINLAEEIEERFEPALTFRQRLTAKMSKAQNSTDEGAKMLLDLVDIGFMYGMMAGIAGAYEDMEEEAKATPVYKRVWKAVKA